MRVLIAACAFALGSSAPLRAPSVPLAVSTPFFSIWSNDASRLATQTSFWHGEDATLDVLLRVDNTTFVLAGASTVGAPAVQLGLPTITALSSTYAFSAGGVRVTLRFTTPALPSDAVAASRSGTYIQWALASEDGTPHAASVLFGASGETVTGGYAGENFEWDRPAVPGAVALRIGLTGQRAPGFNISARLHASTEPHQRADFGFVYILANSSDARVSSVIAPASTVHAAFATVGALPGASGDAVPPASAVAVGSAVTELAVAFDLGTLPGSGAPVTARALLLCDEVVSVLSYDTMLPPLWRKAYPVGDTTIVPADALTAALADSDTLIAAADAFDASLAPALTSAAGADFAAVVQLTFRQVSGANGVTWNGSSVWAFQKEISSDGDMSTLDVIFPSAPQHLYFARAQPLLDLLEPLLFIMGGHSPVHFNQPCAFHSAGKWPVVDVGNGGCSMPMESTGDVLILAAAVTMARGGDATWAAPYMPTLGRFATYCIESLPFPAPQDMTDDFSHAPGNLTNLALKCILGIGAQGYHEQASGNVSGATALYASAHAFGAGFASMAWSTTPAPHWQFIYNSSWAPSYGLMYNAYWYRLLGLESLVPNFSSKFAEHYDFIAAQPANATWCIPLSSMEHDSKWDWLVYTAATAFTNVTQPQPSAYSAKVLAQLVTYVNTTGDHFPLSDHPTCTGPAPPRAAADRARPVLGAFFAPLLIAAPPPAFVEQRAAIASFLAAHLSMVPAAKLRATGPALSWFSASDTHLGHDPKAPNGTVVTSYEKNVWAIHEMNNLPSGGVWPNSTWPDTLGGGPVLPPVGVTISGDLIDSANTAGTAVNSCNQWANFTALYGLDGTDGLLKYKCYEGRGNHDGDNSSTTMPHDCTTMPARGVIARNKLRVADESFNITGTSTPTGLHYSWDWALGPTCTVHFVHLNLYPGHGCGSPANPSGEGTPGPGFPCTDSWTWAESSLDFLSTDLAAHAVGPGKVVVTLQHYGVDGWSNTWYNQQHRVEMWATLAQYNTLAVLVGHTHAASVYAFNGTKQGEWASGTPGFIDVINAPATQKEDGKLNPLPSEFMVLEAALEADGSNKGTFRVAQRVGSGWGKVMGEKPFTC